MNIIKIKLIGSRPLLMHADCLADPLNPQTKLHKEMTAKRKKSDQDHEAIAKSEWRSGLYYDEQLGPYLPGININSAIIEGAKLSKLGKLLNRSIEVMDEKPRLDYDGPRKIEKLWDARFYDARSVKISTSRIMRYRPIFKKWECTCEIAFDDEAINRDQLISCVLDAGKYIGIGDYRPRFGRFTMEVI